MALRNDPIVKPSRLRCPTGSVPTGCESSVATLFHRSDSLYPHPTRQQTPSLRCAVDEPALQSQAIPKVQVWVRLHKRVLNVSVCGYLDQDAVMALHITPERLPIISMTTSKAHPYFVICINSILLKYCPLFDVHPPSLRIWKRSL